MIFLSQKNYSRCKLLYKCFSFYLLTCTSLEAYEKKECEIDLLRIKDEISICIDTLPYIEDAIITVRPKIKVENGEVYFSQAQIKGKRYADRILKYVVRERGGIALKTEVVPKYKGTDSAEVLIFSDSKKRKSSLFDGSILSFNVGTAVGVNDSQYQYFANGLKLEKEFGYKDHFIFSSALQVSRYSSDQLRNLNSLDLVGSIKKPLGEIILSLSGSLGVLANSSGKSLNPGISLSSEYSFKGFDLAVSSSWSKNISEINLGCGVRL